MANMSNYLENKLVDRILRGVSFTFPTSVWVALCTAAPSDTSTGSTIAEVSGGNYARASLACNTTNWAATNGAGTTTNPSSGTGGTTSNNTVLDWGTVTWSGVVSHLAVVDAATLGNVLWHGALVVSRTVQSGDTVSIAAGLLTVQVDN